MLHINPLSVIPFTNSFSHSVGCLFILLMVSFILKSYTAKLVGNLFLWNSILLISWLQSPCAVILEPKKIKSDTVSTVSPSISHEVMGPDLHFLNVEL